MKKSKAELTQTLSTDRYRVVIHIPAPFVSSYHAHSPTSFNVTSSLKLSFFKCSAFLLSAFPNSLLFQSFFSSVHYPEFHICAWRADRQSQLRENLSTLRGGDMIYTSTWGDYVAGHAKCWLHHHLIVSRFKSFSQMTLVPGSLKGKHSWFLFLYLSHTFNSLSLFRLIALCSDDAELYLRQLPSGSVMELIISRGPKAALLSTILLTPCLHEAKRRGHSSTPPPPGFWNGFP